MKYKVTYEYRGKVTVEVEAASEREAEQIGLREADECVELSVCDVQVREVKR